MLKVCRLGLGVSGLGPRSFEALGFRVSGFGPSIRYFTHPVRVIDSLEIPAGCCRVEGCGFRVGGLGNAQSSNDPADGGASAFGF